MHFKTAPFLEIETQKIDILKKENQEGVIYLKSSFELDSRPFRMTANIEKWATEKPNQVFLGQKDDNNNWQTINYSETFKAVLSIGEWLLSKGGNAENPVLILSENSIEHALVGFAALHVGIPYSPLTPAYSTKSSDYAKLIHSNSLLTPKIYLVSDGFAYQNALQKVADGTEVIYIKNKPEGNFNATSFEEILKTEPTQNVHDAFNAINPETIAKIMFTSGSTGLPKGVINTHHNITTNWQQIVQVFPIMKSGFTLIDWLPWNHTFGSNHNLGLTLFNGGTLYIDNGNPTPKGILQTVQNIREIQPDIYFNVPKGFEELIPFLKSDDELRTKFFSNLKLLFYAGAGMPQHVWDAYEELSHQTTGKRLLISTGLGCTEACPSALFNTEFGSFAGMIGVPVQGLELKLLPNGGKLEVRFKGENIMPGYWRNHDATQKAFDEEGFYITGDALKFVDETNPNKGMVFDGRIAEDFKLNTGTWVSVSTLRAKLIAGGNGFIQDVVITGHDKPYVGAIVFIEKGYLTEKFGIINQTAVEISENLEANKLLEEIVNNLKKDGSGSSTTIKKAIIAPFELSAEKGEITDKGSINQRAVLTNRVEIVENLYS